MRNPIREAKEELSSLILAAIRAAAADGALPEGEAPQFTVEIPNDPAHGDFAANAAMVSARAFHKPPRQIAEAIVAHLSLEGTHFERAEIAGPGFLNFFASGRWLAGARRYFLQTFVDSGDLVGEGCAPFSPAEMGELAQKARPWFKSVEIRGI